MRLMLRKVMILSGLKASLHEAKSKQACTRQACLMKIGVIAISARSDALVAMFA